MKQWEKNLQYTCSRCSDVITEKDPVKILTDFETKEVIDLCSSCIKDFHIFMRKGSIITMPLKTVINGADSGSSIPV